MLLLGARDIDKQVLTDLYAGSRPAVAAIAIGFTALGEWPVVVLVSVLAAIWLVRQGKRRLAVLLLVGSLVARALVIIQKYEFARLRPEEHLRLVEVSSKSFPSAHSANSMLVYPLCALLLAPEQWRRVAVTGAMLLSLCIGVSRVVLGVHWPSDVVGGWSFGLLSLLVLLRIDASTWHGT
jgi:undecaprenyl-diphosphatase